MAPPTAIIFGPTGNIGSIAARTAQELGSRVILAMRDPGKAIPGLSPEEEKAGEFERVQTDLTDTKSIDTAVRKTEAKHAFIYIVPGVTDHMRSSVEALKSAGVEFVVLISTASVHGDMRKITPAEFIPYIASRAEISLSEVFGNKGYIALRPGYFCTNASWWAGMIREGDVKIAYPDVTFDWISPDDIGRVAGTVLVKGMQATEGSKERNSIALYGPKLVSQRDAVGIIGKTIGKDVKVTELDEKGGVDSLVKYGVPEFVALPLMKSLGGRHRGEKSDMYESHMYDAEIYDEAKDNIRKHTGQDTRLDEWTQKNKDIFT